MRNCYNCKFVNDCDKKSYTREVCEKYVSDMEDTAKYEVDRKHSMLPWESDIDVDGVAITCNKGRKAVAVDMSIEDCLFMVKACNSYYDNQQRIQELEEALRVINSHNKTCIKAVSYRKL